MRRLERGCMEQPPCLMLGRGFRATEMSACVAVI